MPQIILADKSDLFRRSLTSVLAREGYEVVSSETGNKALALAQASRPAVIILDVDVPEPGGLETLVRFKADPGLRRLPVVMVSKETTPVAVSNAFKLGAEGFLVKPIDLNALIKTIGQLHAPSPELNGEVTVAAPDASLVGKLRFIDQYGQIYLDKPAAAEGQAAGATLAAPGSLVTLSYEIGKETYVQQALLAEENDQGLGLFPAGQAVSAGSPELYRLSVSLKARYLLPGTFVRLADITQVTADSLQLRGLQSEPGFNSEIQVTLYPYTSGGTNAGVTVRGKVTSFHTHPTGTTDVEVSLTEPGGLGYVDMLAELIAGKPARANTPQEVAP